MAGVLGPSFTDRPPLSEKKNTTVFEASFKSSSFFRTRPTLSSTLSITAA